MIAQVSVIVLDVLLAATLIYLTVLLRKLKVLRTYKADMKAIVNDVIMATESARDAVAKLKGAVIESQTTLAQHVEDARKIETTIELKLADAQKLMQAFDRYMADPALKRGSDQQAQRPRMAFVPSQARETAAPSLALGDLAQHSAPPDQFDPEMSQRLSSISEAVSNLRAKIAAHS